MYKTLVYSLIRLKVYETSGPLASGKNDAGSLFPILENTENGWFPLVERMQLVNEKKAVRGQGEREIEATIEAMQV